MSSQEQRHKTRQPTTGHAGEKERMMEKGRETEEASKSKANEAKDKVSETAQAVRERAEEETEGAKEKASEAGEHAKETANAGKEKTGGFLQQTGQKVKNIAQGAVKAVKHTFGMAADEKSHPHQDAHTTTGGSTTAQDNSN